VSFESQNLLNPSTRDAYSTNGSQTTWPHQPSSYHRVGVQSGKFASHISQRSLFFRLSTSRDQTHQRYLFIGAFIPVEVTLRNLIPNQRPKRAVHNGNLPSSDHPCQSMICPPGPNPITRNVDNTLPGKLQPITVVQILLLQPDIRPEDLPRNFLLPVSLGITSYNYSSSKRRVDTITNNHSNLGTPTGVMHSNLYTASSNQSQTSLINSANSMSLARRDSAFKQQTYLRLLLIHKSCNSHLRKLSCPRMRP